MDHSHHNHMDMEPSPPIGHQHMDMSGMSGHEGHGGGGEDGACTPGHMIMFFHTGNCETVLFESWTITTPSALIGSMIGIFFMAALYEGLKYYREYLFWRTYNNLQYRSVSFPTEKKVVEDDTVIAQPKMLSWIHALQTLLHMIQIVLSYFLMLIFMTFNVWLCSAVVVGAAVGYFLFGWKKSVIVDVTEHCH